MKKLQHLVSRGCSMLLLALFILGIQMNSNSHGAGAPTFSNVTAVTVDMNTAIIKGTCNPNGFATKIHVDYGLTTALGKSTPEQDIGSGTDAVPFAITLSFDSLGTYRTVATSANAFKEFIPRWK
jgi:hypothetical protein